MNQLRTVSAVAIGGAAGAGCRWSLLSLFDSASDDILIFLLNIAGSALLGAILSQRPYIADIQFQFAGAGVTGGLTTFSTFAVDVAKLIDNGQLTAAIVTTAVTTTVAVVFAGIGYRIGWEVRR